MKRSAMMLLALSTALVGCAMEAQELEEVGEAQGEVRAHNDLAPNGLTPNGLTPNGLTPNALAPASLSDTNMAILQAPGLAGDAARQFVKYAVECAFDADHSFSFSRKDSSNVPHQETYWGSLGLATEWQTGALSEEGQKWVSACLAARTNQYGLSVIISLRNAAASPALDADLQERLEHPFEEGAFWGNLFSDTPEAYSCYHDVNRAHSRVRRRVCASGYLNEGQVRFCENIQSVGSCSQVCTPDLDPGKGYASCGDETRVITVFLD